MNSIILSCPTLKKELLAAMREYGCHTPVMFMPRELHSDPQYLHTYVQDKIDRLYNIDHIIICTSGCGGGTIGLKASTAELIIPRTRDCLDILLSDQSLKTLKRNYKGVFFTDSWLEFMKNSSLDLDRLEAEKGKEGAVSFIRKLYGSINQFYIINTGCYDMAPVRAYVDRMVKILNGTVEEIPGSYGILKKMAANHFDEDFLIVPKGGQVPENFVFPISDSAQELEGFDDETKR